MRSVNLIKVAVEAEIVRYKAMASVKRDAQVWPVRFHLCHGLPDLARDRGVAGNTHVPRSHLCHAVHGRHELCYCYRAGSSGLAIQPGPDGGRMEIDAVEVLH